MRPHNIFRVKESADRHHRTMYILQVRRDVPRLPEIVIRRMVRLVVPIEIRILQVSCLCVADRSHLQIKLERIIRSEIEFTKVRWRQLWFCVRLEKSIEANV